MKKAKTLKNGMRVHLIPFAGTKAATVLVLVKVGSRYETLKVWGASHFIEHLMFKGTKKRPTTLDISRELDQYGANYNAFTGKDLTGYYVKIDGQHVPLAIDILHDMIFQSQFDAKEMKREKGVIIEEIKMYEENPIMHLDDLLEEAAFEGSTLGRDIAGTKKSMTAMKRTDVIAYRDAYYKPSEIVIAIAGNVPKNATELLEKTFGRVKASEKPDVFVPFETSSQNTIRIKRQYKPLEQIQLGLGWHTEGKASDKQPAMSLLATILGGTMSSRLFTEVRERRGLAYSISARNESYEDVGLFQVRAGLDAKRLPLALKTIFTEIDRMVKSGVTAKELQFAKDHIAGSLALQLENSSSYARFIAGQELYFGEVKTPEEKLAEYMKVTRKQIQQVAEEIFDHHYLSVGIIGPYKTDADVLKNFPALKI